MKFVIFKVSFIKTAVSPLQMPFSRFLPILEGALIHWAVWKVYGTVAKLAIPEHSFLREITALEQTSTIVLSFGELSLIVVTIIVDDSTLHAISVFKYALKFVIIGINDSAFAVLLFFLEFTEILGAIVVSDFRLFCAHW